MAGKRTPKKLAEQVQRWPWSPVFLEPHEIAAVKAIPETAFGAILKLTGGGGGFGNPFTPGGEDGRRATDFGCGKLWVGNTLLAIRAARMPDAQPSDLPNSPTPKTS